MPQSRRLIAVSTILFAALIQSASVGQTKQEEPRKVVTDPEEYQVYNTLLNTTYYGKDQGRFVISLETSSSRKSAFIGIRTGITFSGAKRPDVESETSANFDAQNQDTFELANRFALKIPYSLVNFEELKSIFPLEEGKTLDMECWNRFYKKYPKSHGIIGFSRVGFNSKKTQALVYAANQSNFVGGSGRFFVLSKQTGHWEVREEVVVWLS